MATTRAAVAGQLLSAVDDSRKLRELREAVCALECRADDHTQAPATTTWVMSL